MLKYLSNNEKYKTKKLYKQAFYSDSDKFIDYYYKEKIKDNKILAYEENNEILSMAHLNPYKINFFKNIYKIYYIVAVATDIKHRRKGLMSKVISKFLNDMYKENKPFTFLLPENEAYYSPFDFVFINNYENIRLNNTAFDIYNFQQQDLKELIKFSNTYLSKNYNAYILKDEDYFLRYLKEIQSENGFILIYKNKNKIIGFEAFWGLDKLEKREALILNEFSKKEITNKPAYMLRIINLFEFLTNFTLKDNAINSKLSIILKIKDNIIKENTGIYIWKPGKYCSTLKKYDYDFALPEDKNIFKYDINSFTKSFLIDKRIGNIDISNLIKTLDSIYLNEIV